MKRSLPFREVEIKIQSVETFHYGCSGEGRETIGQQVDVLLGEYAQRGNVTPTKLSIDLYPKPPESPAID